MIIIGFVVAAMIFSSFAIVFNNSGNTLTNVKNNSNLNVKSFTTNETYITLSDTSSSNHIEFYKNFMVYIASNNYFMIENLSSGIVINSTLTYNTGYAVDYGLIIVNSTLYLYMSNDNSDGCNVYIYLKSFTLNLDTKNSYSYEEQNGNFGIYANSKYIFGFVSGNGYDFTINVLNYNLTSIAQYLFFPTDTTTSLYENIYNDFLEIYFNDKNYFINFLTFTCKEVSSNYGEIIYNGNYQSNYTNIYSDTGNFISNDINYCYSSPYYKYTTNSTPDLVNKIQSISDGSATVSMSEIYGYFYNNLYINSSGYLIYDNYKLKLGSGSYTLPYTINSNNLYYQISYDEYGIVKLSKYTINITSYNHNSNQIKDYFYYNDNIYSGLQFNFTNSNGIFSILPLNYSVYTYNSSYITTNSSDFKSIGNDTYQYNLSIYYNELSTNSTSSIKPLDISNYIYPIGIIIFVSFLGAIVYFSKNERR